MHKNIHFIHDEQRSIFVLKNGRFIAKTAAAHIVTYFLCGLIFSALFDYEALFKLGTAQYFMRDAYGISSLIGPIAQIVRGILYGAILLLFRDSFLEKPHAWLRLWAVVAGLGIICPSSPAPASIEGVIYSQLPWEFHLKIAPEILTQTLLFSIWTTSRVKLKIPEKIKAPLLVTAISGVGFSISGILLALVLRVDFMQSASDIGAFAVMFAALAVVFFMTSWYFRQRSTARALLYYAVCYLSLAGLPTLYNYFSNSLLKSPLSLIISGLPLLAVFLYHKLGSRKERQ